MQVQLTKVELKDGINARTSKPWKRVDIWTNVHGDKKLSTFLFGGNKFCASWKAGETVEINPVQNGAFWNFDPIKSEKVVPKSLEDRVKALEAEVFGS